MRARTNVTDKDKCHNNNTKIYQAIKFTENFYKIAWFLTKLVETL